MEITKYGIRAKHRQYLAALLVNLIAFSIGNAAGWTSPMIPSLMSSSPPIGSEPMTAETISWIGSVVFIGSIIGSLFWGVLSDAIGRKSVCLLSAIPCVIGWCMTLMAQNSEWLITARLIFGLTFSGVFVSAPVYVTEIADDNIRGTLVSYLALFFNAGLLFSYIVGAFTSYHILTIVCLSVPLIFLLTFCWFPESPTYLLTKGKIVEAEESLLWFRGGDKTEVVKEMAKLQSKQKRTNKIPLKSLFTSRGIMKAVFISFILMIGQTLSGSVVIMTYAVKMLQLSNTPLSPHVSAITVGSLQFFSVFVSLVLVDRAGRKILLAMSYTCMAFSLAVLGTFLFFENKINLSVLGWIPTASLCLHLVAYSLGLGPVTVVVISEILPQDIKSYVIAKLHMIKAFTAFLSIKCYPFMVYHLNNYGYFWLLGFWCVLFGLITVTLLPETKCKSLQEILKLLDKKGSPTECVSIVVDKSTKFDSFNQTNYQK